MKIATLGPEGTFSHEAVQKRFPEAEIRFTNTIREVFEIVSHHPGFTGVVPLENSLSGSIGLTMDALMSYDAPITSEILLPIRHFLVGNGAAPQIKYLYAHPQAYEQCQRFIQHHLSKARMIPTSSNANSAEELLKNGSKEYAAIIPEAAMNRYALPCLARNIEDSKYNVTRFIVLEKRATAPTGRDRTSIAIYPHIDKPGLLNSLLSIFAKAGINLTKLESRPSKGKLGDYIFFVDLEGHKNDKNVNNAFKSVQKNFYLKVLGSYPREY